MYEYACLGTASTRSAHGISFRSSTFPRSCCFLATSPVWQGKVGVVSLGFIQPRISQVKIASICQCSSLSLKNLSDSFAWAHYSFIDCCLQTKIDGKSLLIKMNRVGLVDWLKWQSTCLGNPRTAKTKKKRGKGSLMSFLGINTRPLQTLLSSKESFRIKVFLQDILAPSQSLIIIWQAVKVRGRELVSYLQLREGGSLKKRKKVAPEDF